MFLVGGAMSGHGYKRGHYLTSYTIKAVGLTIPPVHRRSQWPSILLDRTDNALRSLSIATSSFKSSTIKCSTYLKVDPVLL